MGDQEMKPFTRADVRVVFVRWEELRILYNVIVGLVGVAGAAACVFAHAGLLSYSEHVMPLSVLAVGIVCYGLAANLCYLLGPVIESYARWLGLRVSHLTQALFIAGTAFSALVTGLISLMMWATVLFTGFD